MLRKLFALLALGMMGAVAAAPLAATPLVITTMWDADDSSLIVGRLSTAVNEIAMAFPEVRGTTITSSLLPFGYYAIAFDNQIRFNDLYLSDPHLLESMIQSDVAKGFHPSLGRCTPEEFLAYHESAHLIDNAKNRAPRVRVALEYGKGADLPLSGYSFVSETLNPPEALAEAFASTLCNGGNAVEREFFYILTD